MPPIELFTDLDAVRASTAVVPGLPTREQLEEWLVEHDKTEKETEIFDSGELKKFKDFTMGEFGATFFLTSPLFVELNDRRSDFEAQFIPARYGYHRAYVDDYIRIRQASAPPAGQVRKSRTTRRSLDLGGATPCRVGRPLSTVTRSSILPVAAREMVPIRL